ncbi:hypothetical protein BD414DRAFT_86681 [Trametes punicea]|nr:hypothetical protein BD414DRAFT_86681 [Trametes punicea]
MNRTRQALLILKFIHFLALIASQDAHLVLVLPGDSTLPLSKSYPKKSPASRFILVNYRRVYGPCGGPAPWLGTRSLPTNLEASPDASAGVYMDNLCVYLPVSRLQYDYALTAFRRVLLEAW